MVTIFSSKLKGLSKCAVTLLLTLEISILIPPPTHTHTRAHRNGETVWDAYLRRKREKAKQRRAQGRKGDSSSSDSDDAGGAGQSDDEGAAAHAAGDEFFQHGEDPFNDPFFQVRDSLSRGCYLFTCGGFECSST